MSNARTGRPPRIWVCTVFANDRSAGKLLSWIAGIAKHATQRRRGHQGLWNANSRAYILAQTGLTLNQYWRARDILIECDGAEFLDGGFAGKRSILTRPTPTLMRILDGAVSRCRAREMIAQTMRSPMQPSMRPPMRSNTLCSPCTPAPQHSAGVGGTKGREGQPTRDAAAPPAPASPPARQDSTVRPLIRRTAARAADAGLVARVQDVLDRYPGKPSPGRRTALLAALPERHDVPGIRAPSQMYGEAWQGLSAEVLAHLHAKHLAYAERSARKRGIGRPSGTLRHVFTDADLTPETRAATAAVRNTPPAQTWEEIEADERARVVALREQGLADPAEIATRLGMSEAAVRDHLTVADWHAEAAE